MRQKGWMKKMQNKGFEDHHKRMQEMKCIVDCGPPRAAPQSKKKEIERRRQYAAIELDNRLILERLAKVMQQKTIDNENRVKMGKSLTQTHRKLELQRITQENQRLLRRIQETEPCYNHLDWEEDFKRRQQYISNMSEYAEQNMKIPIGQLPKRHGQLKPLHSTTGSRGSRSPKTPSIDDF